MDNTHANYFGSPGVYGQRMANKVLYHADTVLAIGNRLSIWQVGYTGLRPEQRLVMVDIDAEEVAKFPQADWVNEDARKFIERGFPVEAYPEWLSQCAAWKEKYPLLEFMGAHADIDGYINSYRFMSVLQQHLATDAIIVTDAGGACCSAWQVLQVKPPQRMMTSGGLGEMGCGLPAAIGAAVATGKQVICIVGDGAMMLNLQELATIRRNNLNVKIIVFCNDGYSMIRRSQDVMGLAHTAVGAESGLGFPDFVSVAHAFGIKAFDIIHGHSGDSVAEFLRTPTPELLRVQLHPEQMFVPKLNPIMVDGKPTSPSFHRMSPLL